MLKIAVKIKFNNSLLSYDKAKPVVRQGRKAPGLSLLRDSRVTLGNRVSRFFYEEKLQSLRQQGKQAPSIDMF